MNEQPRNWDRELADIDKVIAQEGSVPATSGAGPTPAGRAGALPGAAPVRRRSVALTWFWVLLALALALALPLWPYERSCGLKLMFFMGAAGVTALAGLLAALASWAHRRGLAHVLSLAVIGWAAVMGLREILPRVGYARTVRTWTCEVAPGSGGSQGPGPAGPAAAGPPGPAPSDAASPAQRSAPAGPGGALPR